MEMDYANTNWVDIALWSWFALTGVSVIYVAWDLLTRTPEMKVMKWGWILVTFYTGIVGLAVYWLSCREPTPGSHEKFVAPLWKQSVGSTIHCLAGDATGIIFAAAATSFLALPMWFDSLVEYFVGFAVGLFIFQALFMKDMLGGSYWEAVRGTWLAEWLSMNAVMAGMIPVMIILMTRDMTSMEPTSVRFWGIMSFAALVGAVLAFPVNWWLVKKGLKHGMGTERALGKGGAKTEIERERLAEAVPDEFTTTPHGTMQMQEMPHTADRHKATGDIQVKDSGEMTMPEMKVNGAVVSAMTKVIVTFLTLAMLAAGVLIAARFGDFSMRATDTMSKMPMPDMKH